MSGRGDWPWLLVRGYYRLLLCAYPRDFRREEGEEAARVFVEACRGSRRERGVASLLRRLATALFEVPWRGLGERWALARAARRARWSGGSSWSPQLPERHDGWKARSLFSGVARDLRHTLRSLRHQPAFALAVVATLALGIGANTAMFSVIDATLLRPFDFPDADRVVYVSAQRLDEERGRNPTLEELWLWTPRVDAIERVEAYDVYSVPYVTDEGAIWVLLHQATPGYLDAMEVEPLIGRLLRPDDARPDAVPVTVIAETVWRRHLSSNPAAIGATVTLGATLYTVVGVVPDAPGGRNDRFYVPLSWTGPEAPRTYVRGIAWLRSGTSAAEAAAQLRGVSLTEDEAGVRWVGDLQPPGNIFWRSGELRLALLSLMGTVFLVLAIACVNVANLMMARGSSRQGELALRSALGASGARLARLLLVESMGLAAIGGLFGVLVAWGTVALIKTQDPGFAQLRDRLDAVRIDGFVLAYATLIALATGLAFGLVPAWRTASAPQRQTLQRADPRGGRGRSRGLLVTAETALGVLLLIAAGLVSRAFLEIRFTDPGFAADRILSVRLALPNERYPSAERKSAFYDALLARAARLPGVEEASIGYGALPPFELGAMGALERAGSGAVDENFFVSVIFARPEYFRLMGIPLQAGRGLEAADLREERSAGDRSVVVSRALAQRLQPDGNAVGTRFRISGFRDDRWSRVVGIVGDVSGRDLLSACTQCGWQLYLPLEPERRYTEVLLRLAEGVPPPTAGLREAIKDLDPLVPSNDELETAAAGLQRFRGEPRFRAVLFGSFAAIAVVLAALGIFGVVAYTVSQRTREMGIRLALGARPEEVRRLAVIQGMVPVIAGIVLGVAGALAAGRLMAGLLYGVSPADPLTFVATVTAFVAIAALATWIPASRATRVDPVIALRSE